MVLRESKGPIQNGITPDPGSASLSPNFGVSLVRELRSLLKTERDGPADPAVALGARPLATIFGDAISSNGLHVDKARNVTAVEVGGFTAWPIFITYSGSSTHDRYAPTYNINQIDATLKDFYGPGLRSTRLGIHEAIRNVGQHGHRQHDVKFGECRFAPAALLTRELSVDGGDGVRHRVLMAVVTDEGPGITSPERSMLNGIGSGFGHDTEGMGVELKNSLLHLVKSNQGEWSLFDGLHHSNPNKYASKNLDTRRIGEDEKVKRITAIDLPAPSQGCQKIMFFAQPSVTSEESRRIQSALLEALEPLRG
jgi:anti-sigma regulatory factor (Ser/Thr protein kinase)